MQLIRKQEKPVLHLDMDSPSGVPMLRFPAIDQTGMVHCGFTTRHGGVSEGWFSSLNLKSGNGDMEEAIRENFKRVAAYFNADLTQFVATDQTHTANVRVVTAEDAGKGITRERDYHDVDGMVTNVPGLILSAFYADCVPLY